MRALLCLLLLALPAKAADVAAGAPRDLSVTIYRAPERGAGGIDLSSLEGFALVTETRDVEIPAGTTRLRFEGVADGIEPASALVTGLPSGVIEKNRDARLLSPAALVAATVGKPVDLVRTNRKTGKTERIRGRIRSDAEGGVVFEGPDGLEGLRCSGLSETFDFDPAASAVSARPTLSVVTRSDRPLRATVTLAYLARDFDWAANYVATLSADGRTLDLGAWVTLANGNGTGFPDSRTQVVAGRLNKESGEVEPIDLGEPILARCWPRGSTSDHPLGGAVEAAPTGDFLEEVVVTARMMASPPAPMAMAKAIQVVQEQLGDLKLYRVPERTTVASRQAKQVRLLDREAVPVERIYGTRLPAGEDADVAPAGVLLRTRNDAAHHLGLPLPSGSVAVLEPRDGHPLLVGEAGLRDTALDEEVELRLGASPDIQVRQVRERRRIDLGRTQLLPLLPGIVLRAAPLDDICRVEISNAGLEPIQFELGLILPDGSRVVRADHAMTMKNGRPLFRLAIPAGETAVVRYQTERPA